VTDRLLHGAPCPVAVATAGFSADRLDLIGVAFLERPDGRAALAHGCELARAAGGRVRIITVREPTDWRFSGPLEASQLAAAEQARDEAAQRAMRTGLGAVPESCAAGGEVVTGEPHQVLAAASADLDLLVCGSRGHGPVQTLLLGGVSHALVREAACPVLVVPLAEPAAAARNGQLRLAEVTP
jgi:nucleotide-binding universal stress UspA family protein